MVGAAGDVLADELPQELCGLLPVRLPGELVRMLLCAVFLDVLQNLVIGKCLLPGLGFLPATACGRCIPGIFVRFLEVGISRDFRFLRLRESFRLSGIFREPAILFLMCCMPCISTFRLVFVKAVDSFLVWCIFCIRPSILLQEPVPDELQGVHIALVAVGERLEHLPAGAAALDLLCVGEQAVEAADLVVHLVDGMEGARQPGEGQVAAVMELFVREQRPVRPQVVQATQVRRDDPDGQVRGLDGGGREEVEHVGAAVQDDVVHQLCRLRDEQLYLFVLQFRVGEGVLPGGIAHDADEGVLLQDGDALRHQGRVDLQAGQHVPDGGACLQDALRLPDGQHGRAGVRVDDEGLVLVRCQHLGEAAAEHGLPAAGVAPYSDDL